MRDKRGQITIFIIVAIVIVAAVGLFFLFRTGVTPRLPGLGDQEINPEAFLDFCLKDKVKEGISLISKQGGYISNPLHRRFKFTDEDEFINISYLCYTDSNIGERCKNQESMLIPHLEGEVKTYIAGDVQTCFSEFVRGLEDKGYTVNSEYKNFEIDLSQGRVNINMDAELSATKAEETLRVEDLKVIIASRLYDIALVVHEIVNSEAGPSCDFDYSGYMVLYPEFGIDLFKTGDSTKIYTVEYRNTGEWFRLAVSGCGNQ